MSEWQIVARGRTSSRRAVYRWPDWEEADAIGVALVYAIHKLPAHKEVEIAIRVVEPQAPRTDAPAEK